MDETVIVIYMGLNSSPGEYTEKLLCYEMSSVTEFGQKKHIDKKFSSFYIPVTG